jgi:hypothetical protein
MAAFLFTCPNTGMNVHAWATDEVVAFQYFEAVECTACKRVHLVDPRTGRIVGESK